MTEKNKCQVCKQKVCQCGEMSMEEKDVFDEVLEDLPGDQKEDEKEILQENKKKRQILFGNWNKNQEV